MANTILIGHGREITRIPRQGWEEGLAAAPQRIAARLDFMTEDHHAVRYHVVRELPRMGRPMPADAIAGALELSMERTREILDDLEQRLFFLVRNGDGEVEWAFPVTVAATGHNLLFSTGERLDAA